jgi:sirohydrochlorin cobaltochelatase
MNTVKFEIGIILFAHGSRDPQWRVPIEAVASQIRRHPDSLPVRCAYLELCEPDIAVAATDLIAAGARKIRVFPLFLGVGKHAREDLPLLMATLINDHPDIEFELLPTAGENAELIGMLAELAMR